MISFSSNKITPALCASVLLITALLTPPVAEAVVPVPVDKPYPGTITLKVDATNVDQKIFRVHASIPVRPGKLTLLYPQWLPGKHSPFGPLSQLAGLKFSGNGRPIAWKRDTVDMFAFHLEVPAGVGTLEAEYQFLSPTEGSQGRITATNEIVGVQWNTVALYPAGHYARNILFQPSVILPEGWQSGTALELAERAGNELRFKPVNLDEMVDSPLFAGKYFRRFDLDPGARLPVFLNVVADRVVNLDAKPEHIELHKALVQQTYRLFGSQHFSRYDFLMALSDEFGGIGLEHHQSTEIGISPGYFTDWTRAKAGHDVVAHEFVHSWNGKFRRPADLNTPNFNVPMQGSLLWLYEGQTQYWGYVLTARSGLMSAAQAREAFAATAARFELRVGRDWRAMQDTTNEPIITGRRYQSWPSWQRSEDYYSEGELIWLDIDTKIRELSGDTRSLNDFARGFFGIDNGSRGPVPYTFEQVVKALNAVQQFDWAPFLRARLDGNGPGAPLDGLTRAGWKLVYTEQMSDYLKNFEEQSKSNDFSYSLGFSVDKEGKLGNLQWNGLAFKAGIVAGSTLLAVNGRGYKAELLKAAITEAKNSKEAIELLLKKGDRYRMVRLDYHEGLKYPNLARIEGTPDRLEAILQALP